MPFVMLRITRPPDYDFCLSVCPVCDVISTRVFNWPHTQVPNSGACSPHMGSCVPFLEFKLVFEALAQPQFFVFDAGIRETSAPP